MKSKALKKLPKAAPAGLSKTEVAQLVEGALDTVMRRFAGELRATFDYHGRRVDEAVGVIRELDADNRGILLEFAKFKQLHRTEAELEWLNGIHGRAAMETFKETVGLTSFAQLMRERVKELEKKRGAVAALPAGVAAAPRYTWWCDACPPLENGNAFQGGEFATQAEAHEARAAHVKEKHPEQTEGPVVEAAPS